MSGRAGFRTTGLPTRSDVMEGASGEVVKQIPNSKGRPLVHAPGVLRKPVIAQLGCPSGFARIRGVGMRSDLPARAPPC